MNHHAFFETRYEVVLSCALGLCLATSESRQYTAIFSYNGSKSPFVVVLSLLVVLVGFGVLLFCLRSKRRYSLALGVVGGLSVLQTVAIVCQCYDFGFISQSEFAQSFAIALGESYQVVFVFITVLLANRSSVGSVRDFIFAFGLAATFQLFTALLRGPVAMTLICLLPAIVFALILFARQTAGRAEEPIDELEPEKLAAPYCPTFRFSSGALIICIFLMGALLICTHAVRMSYQDGGAVSLFIQSFSGIAGILAAVAVYCFNARLTEITRLTLGNLLVLTVLLSALYITSLFHGFAVLGVLILLHRLAYILVWYLIWQICLTPFCSLTMPKRFAAAFLTLKLGWAVGVLLFMTLPTYSPSTIASALPVVFLVFLIIIDIYIFIGTMNGSRAHSPSVEAGTDATSWDPMPVSYRKVCATVAEKYSLTKREMEVLSYLGRGRTAAYIEKEMCISSGTTRTHIDHIYKKMDIHSQQELIDIIEQSN